MEFWLNTDVLIRRLAKGRYGQMAAKVRSGRDINDVVKEQHEHDAKVAAEVKRRRMASAIVQQKIVADMAHKILMKSLIYCPIDTGKLRASARLTIHPDGDKAMITYGGKDVKYAVYVHEIPEYYHRPPTQCKFLEEAAKETRDEMNIALKEARLKVEMPHIMMQYTTDDNKIALYITAEQMKGRGDAELFEITEDISENQEPFSILDLYSYFEEDEGGMESLELNEEAYTWQLERILKGDNVDKYDADSLLAFFYNATHKK